MRKNCNLKLQLQPHPPPLPFDLGSPSPDNHLQQQQQQQLTIFYNGQVCVCHVTESQARAIIMHAGRETMMGRSPNGARAPKITRSDQDEEQTTSSRSQMSTPSPGASPTTALSMKRSLQRFLQERRHRISATSPYNVR